MTDTIQEESQTKSRSARDRWLMVAAIAVVAVPVLIGFILMRTGDSPSPVDLGVAADSGSGGMSGSGMGDTGMAGAASAAQTPQGVLDFAQIQATDIRLDLDPDTGSDNRGQHDRGYKPGRYLIHQPLHRSPGALGFCHHMHDLR